MAPDQQPNPAEINPAMPMQQDWNSGVEGAVRVESYQYEQVRVLINKLEDKLQTANNKADKEYWLDTLRMLHNLQPRCSNAPLCDRLTRLLDSKATIDLTSNGNGGKHSNNLDINQLLNLVYKYINYAGNFYESRFSSYGKISVDTAQLVTRLNTNAVIYTIASVNDQGQVFIDQNGFAEVEQAFHNLINFSAAENLRYSEDVISLQSSIFNNIANVINQNKTPIKTKLGSLGVTNAQEDPQLEQFMNNFHDKISKEIRASEAFQRAGAACMHATSGGEISRALKGLEDYISKMHLSELDMVMLRAFNGYLKHRVANGIPPDLFGLSEENGRALKKDEIEIANHIIQIIRAQPNFEKDLPFSKGESLQRYVIGRIRHVIGPGFATGATAHVLALFPNVQQMSYHARKLTIFRNLHNAQTGEQGMEGAPNEESFKAAMYVAINALADDPRKMQLKDIEALIPLDPKLPPKKAKTKRHKHAKKILAQLCSAPDADKSRSVLHQVLEATGLQKLFDEIGITFGHSHGQGEMMQNWDNKTMKAYADNFREIVTWATDYKGNAAVTQISGVLNAAGISEDTYRQAHQAFVEDGARLQQRRLAIRAEVEQPHADHVRNTQGAALRQQAQQQAQDSGGNVDDIYDTLLYEATEKYFDEKKDEINQEIEKLEKDPKWENPTGVASGYANMIDNPRIIGLEATSPRTYQLIRQMGVPAWLDANARAGGARMDGLRHLFMQEKNLNWRLDPQTSNVEMQDPKAVLDWLIEKGGLEYAEIFTGEIINAEAKQLKLSGDEKNMYILHRTQALKARIAYDFALKDPYDFLFNLKGIFSHIDDGYIEVDGKFVRAGDYYFDSQYDGKGPQDQQVRRSAVINQTQQLLRVENMQHMREFMNFWAGAMDDVADVIGDADWKLKDWKTNKKGKIGRMKERVNKALFDTLSHAHQLVLVNGDTKMGPDHVFDMTSNGKNHLRQVLGLNSDDAVPQELDRIDTLLKSRLDAVDRNDPNRDELVRLRLALRMRRSLFETGQDRAALMDYMQKFMAPGGPDRAFGSYNYNDFKEEEAFKIYDNTILGPVSAIGQQARAINLNASGSFFKNLVHAWYKVENKNEAITSGDLKTINLLTANYEQTGSRGSFSGLAGNYEEFPKAHQALNGIPGRIKTIGTMPRGTDWKSAFNEVFADHKAIKEVGDNWQGKGFSRGIQPLYAATLIKGLIHDSYCRLPPPFGLLASLALGNFTSYASGAANSAGENFVLSDMDADSYIHDLFKRKLISDKERDLLVKELRIELWRLNLLIGIPMAVIGTGVMFINKAADEAEDGFEGKK